MTMRAKLLKFIGYPLFFLVCLGFFFVQGFPVSTIFDRYQQQAERQLSMKISYASLGMLFPNGVEAKSIRLSQPEDKGKPALNLFIDRVSARISLISLMLGKRNVSLGAELLSGKLEGEASLSADRQMINGELHEIDLGKITFWKDLIGMQLKGKLTGGLDVDLPSGGIKNAQGKVSLNITAGGLGSGTIRGLTLPPISLGKTQAELEIGNKGKAEIKNFQTQSDDVEAKLDGYFLLQNKLQNMSARCNLCFKFTESFLGRNEKIKNLISLAGLDQAKGGDGFYCYQVFGRLDHLQFRPQKKH
jgi:type II secretion system protein N